MTVGFFNFLTWLCIGVLGLLALAQLLGDFRNRSWLLSGIFGSGAFLVGYLFLFATDRLVLFPGLFMAYVPATVLLTVCIYLYVRCRLEDRGPEMADFWHAFPVLLGLVVYLFFQLWPTLSVLDLMRDLYEGKRVWLFLPFTVLACVTAVYYLIRTMRLDPAYYSFDFRRRTGVTGIFLSVFMIVMTTLALGTIAVDLAQVLTKWILFVFSGVFLVGFMLHIKYPDRMAGWIQEIKQTYEKRYYLNEIDVNATRTRLTLLMEEELLYRDNELSLEKLAGLLAVSRYQLSQLINMELNTTFTRYVQSYRVADAKRLLIEKPERTILSIAYEVGFNSNSAFQSAFKHRTSMTPSEFRTRGLIPAKQ